MASLSYVHGDDVDNLRNGRSAFCRYRICTASSLLKWEYFLAPNTKIYVPWNSPNRVPYFSYKQSWRILLFIFYSIFCLINSLFFVKKRMVFLKSYIASRNKGKGQPHSDTPKLRTFYPQWEICILFNIQGPVPKNWLVLSQGSFLTHTPISYLDGIVGLTCLFIDKFEQYFVSITQIYLWKHYYLNFNFNPELS